ncbi:MAG TPA: response regulator transcription factor [Acidimicrobiales bacterium]|nr:response regulator transcription factor [Acidimicrobiales bacterium]
MKVLLIEDDPGITSFLTKGFTAEGYRTVVTTGVADALGRLDAEGGEFDVVLLDLGLPDGSGEEVLVGLRHRNPTLPVIILTARGRIEDKVHGLDAGANDYVTKPFSFEELLARIRTAVRTTSQPSGHELVIKDLRLDVLTKIASRAGRRIELAPREWALLELFMRNPTQALSRSLILSQVWDYSFDPGSNVVDVYVGYLRRKINYPGLEPMILTVRGTGYRLINP